MQIPFGPLKPSSQEMELLTKLGFDMGAIEKKGKCYYLCIPETLRIHCEKRTLIFDKHQYTLYYNGVNVAVIAVDMKMGVDTDPFMFFSISKPSVEKALARNVETSEEAIEAKSAEKSFSDYQARLEERLNDLEIIIFEDGAVKMIGGLLLNLRDLKIENPEEHEQLIRSNERYQELLKMFPDWADPNSLEALFEKFSEIKIEKKRIESIERRLARLRHLESDAESAEDTAALKTGGDTIEDRLDRERLSLGAEMKSFIDRALDIAEGKKHKSSYRRFWDRCLNLAHPPCSAMARTDHLVSWNFPIAQALVYLLQLNRLNEVSSRFVVNFIEIIAAAYELRNEAGESFFTKEYMSYLLERETETPWSFLHNRAVNLLVRAELFTVETVALLSQSYIGLALGLTPEELNKIAFMYSLLGDAITVKTSSLDEASLRTVLFKLDFDEALNIAELLSFLYQRADFLVDGGIIRAVLLLEDPRQTISRLSDLEPRKRGAMTVGFSREEFYSIVEPLIELSGSSDADTVSTCKSSFYGSDKAGVAYERGAVDALNI
jgi:hypothetical protein